MGFRTDQIEHLKSLGYYVSGDESVLQMKRKNRVPFTILLAGSIVICLMLIFFSGGNRLYLLSIILPVIPVIFYRRNVATTVLIDRRRGFIEYYLGYLMPKFSKNLAEIKKVELNTYNFSSTVSPFKEGNRDFYADVKIKWKDGKMLELFHFTERSAESLKFAADYRQVLDDFLNEN